MIVEVTAIDQLWIMIYLMVAGIAIKLWQLAKGK